MRPTDTEILQQLGKLDISRDILDAMTSYFRRRLDADSIGAFKEIIPLLESARTNISDVRNIFYDLCF